MENMIFLYLICLIAVWTIFYIMLKVFPDKLGNIELLLVMIWFITMIITNGLFAYELLKIIGLIP